MARTSTSREVLLAGPKGLCRHPPSVFVEILRLVCGNPRVARGLPTGEQWQSYVSGSRQGTVSPAVTLSVWVLAGQQTTGPDLGRLGGDLPQNLATLELALLPTGVVRCLRDWLARSRCRYGCKPRCAVGHRNGFPYLTEELQDVLALVCAVHGHCHLGRRILALSREVILFRSRQCRCLVVGLIAPDDVIQRYH